MLGINQALVSRKMDVAHLSDRTGISEKKLSSLLKDIEAASESSLIKISSALAVPVVALFSTRKLELESLPDFRRRDPEPSLLPQGVIRAIGFVERLSAALVGIGAPARRHNSIPISEVPSAKKLAAQWRESWGVSIESQLEEHNVSSLYRSLRKYIEELGIYVLHQSMRTDEVSGFYSQIGSGPPFVVINTTHSSKARKLFTLAHEFGHALLGKEGVSQASLLRNDTEKYCNDFAGMLLAPDDLVAAALRKVPVNNQNAGRLIGRFSEAIGVSQEAAFVRLVKTRHVSFHAYQAWKRQFSGHVPDPDQVDPIRRSKNGPDPIQNKKTHYGDNVLRALAYGLRAGKLDEIDIHHISGIKPKYLPELLSEYAADEIR